FVSLLSPTRRSSDLLVDLPSLFAVFRHEGCCGSPDIRFPFPRSRFPTEEHPSNDPRHIRIHRRDRLLIREARHRPRPIGPHSRELEECLRILGHPAVELPTSSPRK